MRTNPGWHGYWLNPGDAGLPMDVQWQLPRGFVGRAAALSGAEPARPSPTHELCLRARLCRARPAEGAGGRARDDPDPRRRPLARVHRQDLRARAGRLALDLPVGSGTPEPRAVRRVAASLAAAAGDGRTFRSGWRQAPRRSPASGERPRPALHPRSLFYLSPDPAPTTLEAAKRLWNFGVIAIGTGAALRLEIVTVAGDPVYQLDLSPDRRGGSRHRRPH